MRKVWLAFAIIFLVANTSFGQPYQCSSTVYYYVDPGVGATNYTVTDPQKTA